MEEQLNNIENNQNTVVTNTINNDTPNVSGVDVVKPTEITNGEAVNVSQNIASVVENTSNVVEEPQVVVNEPVFTENDDENSDVKISGTATEEEIVIDATKPKEEVIDEDEIKRTIKAEKRRNRRNISFIVAVILVIVAFLIVLPLIIQKIGI